MVWRDEACTLGDRDECPEIVEEIDEEEDKDDFEDAFAESATDVELQRCLREGMKAAALVGPVDEAESPGDSGGDDDADEDGAGHVDRISALRNCGYCPG